MKAARDENDREKMLSALRVNWRLWTIIQAELLDPQCTVPMDIRADVLSLAQFVDKHSVEIIGEPSPKRLDVLISINRELAGGLLTAPQSQIPEGRESEPPQGGGGPRPQVKPIAGTPSGFAEASAAGSSVRIST
jgi:flagellar protein FlaF